MNTDLEEANPLDGKSVIAPLGWFTLLYVISFVAYLGGSQGLWFWYVTLRRPEWGIPGWGFTISWTVVTGFVGAAGWQVQQAESSRIRTTSLVFLGIQQACSTFWPWLFFAMHQQKGAFIEALVLAILTLVTTVLFWRAKRNAGGLMLTALAWSVYISFLCLAIWQGNLS